MRKRIRAALVGLLLACGVAGPVAAGPFDDGVAAFDRKDYATALRLWRPLAAQGAGDLAGEVTEQVHGDFAGTEYVIG